MAVSSSKHFINLPYRPTIFENTLLWCWENVMHKRWDKKQKWEQQARSGVSSSIVSQFYCMHYFLFFPSVPFKDIHIQMSVNRRTSSAELCDTSAWQLVFYLRLFFSWGGGQKHKDNHDLRSNAERQAVGVELKYTSVLFTACLL